MSATATSGAATRILLEILGWAGAAAVVGACGLATSHVLLTDSGGSAWLNMVGAAALMVNCAG